MHIERYEEALRQSWDMFVEKSTNGTFLFQRDYMEYHRDRFEDYSLLVRDDGGTLIALLPANRNEVALTSHGGLTYGGFIANEVMKLPKMLSVFEAVFDHLQQNGFRTLVYKTIPFIYHRSFAEEDRYALFLCRAELVRRGVLAVIDARFPLPMQERRKRGAKKAKQNGLRVLESEDWPLYWEILSKRLRETHNTQPVHTLDEMRFLNSRFPNQIKLFAAFDGTEMRAGIVIFETDRVARVQYIATDERGRALGALDLIISELLSHQYRAKPYFDFGTSDEDGGRCINKGLIDQKEGYGARVVTQDHYQIEISHYRAGQFISAMK
jgi:hypothetical protein